MNRVFSIFQALEGSWRIERYMKPLSQTFEGTAKFTKTVYPQELHYQERGVLTTDKGEKLDSNKEYLYRYENDAISVFFKEKIPRLFHTLTFDEHINYPFKATASHLCECESTKTLPQEFRKFDSYEATYVFFNKGKFSLSYKIEGPKKNYQIDSTFTKIIQDQKEDI